MTGDELASRLDGVRARVRVAAEGAGRDAAAIRVMAVTKGLPAVTVATVLRAGLTDIGENRVGEAQAKQAELPHNRATWHMVGHVQRNKAGAAAAIFDVVHSVDSARLAAALDRHRATQADRLPVFIEVELSGIAGRSGVSPAAASALLAQVIQMRRLEPVGLMTIAPPGSPDAARDCFVQLRTLRDRLRDEQGLPLAELSMGMSDDFEIAVAEGATVVRLGRVLFEDVHGPRPCQSPPLS